MANMVSSWAQTGAVLTVHRWVTVIGGLLLASVVVLVLCLQFGATSVGMGTVATAIGHMMRENNADASGLGTSEIIMVQIRFPRVLMGFLVEKSVGRSLCVGRIERVRSGSLFGHSFWSWIHILAAADTADFWIRWSAVSPSVDLSTGTVKRPIAGS
jgi:hypothetical protein